jgi:Stigma-specific protein, Stig1
MTCAAPEQDCGGGCVDTMTDTEHCGACGNRCLAGQRCAIGACAASRCPLGQRDCAPRAAMPMCVDVRSDPMHCGACGTACAAGEVCTAGRCGCGAGRTLCRGTCVDLQTDEAHCGACGVACSGGADVHGGPLRLSGRFDELQRSVRRCSVERGPLRPMRQRVRRAQRLLDGHMRHAMCVRVDAVRRHLRRPAVVAVRREQLRSLRDGVSRGAPVPLGGVRSRERRARGRAADPAQHGSGAHDDGDHRERDARRSFGAVLVHERRERVVSLSSSDRGCCVLRHGGVELRHVAVSHERGRDGGPSRPPTGSTAWASATMTAAAERAEASPTRTKLASPAT